MKCFVGKSGKFYYKNPHDDGAYCYAVYESKDHYDKRLELPVYVDESTAKSDFDYDKDTEYYQFTVYKGQEEKVKFRTSLLGDLLDEVEGFETGRDYLASLKEEYGQEFKFSFEKLDIVIAA